MIRVHRRNFRQFDQVGQVGQAQDGQPPRGAGSDQGSPAHKGRSSHLHTRAHPRNIKYNVWVDSFRDDFFFLLLTALSASSSSSTMAALPLLSFPTSFRHVRHCKKLGSCSVFSMQGQFWTFFYYNIECVLVVMASTWPYPLILSAVAHNANI